MSGALKHFTGFSNKKWTTYAVPVLFSLSMKIILFCYWFNSPFRFFSNITGLDMQTHMAYARRFLDGGIEFSIYRLIAGAIYLILGDRYFVEGVVATQMLSGVVVTFLIVFLMLHLTRDRLAAMLAGIFAATYSTAAIYECFILPESIFMCVCCITLAVPFYISCRRRFSPLPLFLSGIACTLPLVTKITGSLLSFFFVTLVVMMISRKRSVPASSKRRLCMFFSAGIAAIIIPVSAYNVARGFSFLPLPSSPNFSYVFKLGATENIKSLSLTEKTPSNEQAKPSTTGGFTRKLANYGEKFLMIFHHYEVPNNINCYFVRYFLFPLNLMLKSTVLIPLAIAGMLILLFRQKLMTRYFILFLYLACIALPMIIFVPLARYRLSLFPVFCVFAAYPMVFLRAKFAGYNNKFIAPVLYFVLLTALAYLIGGHSDENYFRSQDFVSYGIGQEKSGRFDSDSVEVSYRTAFLMAPESLSAAIHLSNFLMKKGDFTEAEMILSNFHRQYPDNMVIAVNYAASLLGTGHPSDAEKVLLKIGEPRSGVTRTRYFYQMGEALRLQGRNREAVESFSKAIDNASTKEEVEIIRAALKNIRQ